MHTEPQLTPSGVETTVPLPEPDFDIAKLTCAANTADTARAPSMVTRQISIPVQAPRQPLNANPGAELATSVTTAPPVNWAVQVDPQLMPEMSDTTVPFPSLVTVSKNVSGVAVAVVLVKFPLIPPMVTTVVVCVFELAAAECRTQRVCPFAMVPADAVKTPLQPTENSPPEILMGVGAFVPVRVIGAEVTRLPVVTPVCGRKENSSGVLSQTVRPVASRRGIPALGWAIRGNEVPRTIC